MPAAIFACPVALLILCSATGCIGTDFLEESATAGDPRIEIFPLVSAVQIGEAVAFEAFYYDSTDELVTTPFVWQTTDESVATVSEAGEVTGISMGQVRISASAHGIASEQALLTVVSDPNAVAFVEISPTDTSVVAGRTMQFSASTLNASRADLPDVVVSWQVDGDSLATIDDQGLVATSLPGLVNVTATADGVTSAPVQLEIFPESRTGTFRAAPGTSYTVKGNVTLEAIPGGKLQLRFAANFESSNGPDLNVYLSPEDTINSASINVGQLQSTRGEQIYTLPDFVSMNTFDYVIIHCTPFNVTFGFAPLR